MKDFKLYYNVSSVIYKEDSYADFLLFKDISLETLSQCIAQFVFKKEYLKNYVYNYFKVPKAKQKQLWQEILKNHNGEVNVAIYDDLKRMMWVENYLNLEGYIYFASGNLRRCLLRMAKVNLDKMRKTQEQNEFVEMLRFFVDMSECMYNEIYIVREENGILTIKDELGFDLRDEYLRIMQLEDNEEVNEEDFVLSALITLAPKKIYMSITLAPNLPLVCEVFSEKIIYN